jgi:hypothetical protein
MNYLFISALLVLNTAHCFSPPIDGGKSAPVTSFEYIDVVELVGPTNSLCTGTKVSPTKILTAAHCIERYENSIFSEILKTGDMLFGVGRITGITIHPRYKLAKGANAVQLYTLYDIAFISIEERPSQRKIPYPKIISKDLKPAKRGKLELAGYGTNQTVWNGKNFEFQETKSGLQIGDNTWSECPIDYFDSKVNELEKLNKEIISHLNIKSSRVHVISEGNEVIESDGKAMILKGDSGSPAIERDSNNNFIITGVASNIKLYEEGSGQASLEIEFNGKTISNTSFEKIPENWGLRGKNDSEFEEIQNTLKANGLIDESGNMKSGVKIKRKYKTVTTGNYADLSHPENQIFINSMLKE